MKFVSLFCGIGGFDYALEKLGHECVWANDFNKYAAQIYDKNFSKRKFKSTRSNDGGDQPNTNNSDGDGGWTDTRSVDTRDIRTVPTSEIPDHDLIVGGFPCQSFSIAGNRKGFEDTRGTMFFEIARILRDKRPRYLLLENVKGLLNHDGGKTFSTILNILSDIGYDVQWQVLNSKNFGVPQNRERVFIVGHLRGEPRPKIFPIRGNNPTSLKELSQNQSQGYRVYDPKGISSTLASQAGGMGAKTGLYAVVLDHGVVKEREISNTLDANYWKGLDNHQARTGIAMAWSKSNRTGKSESDKRRKNYGEVEERIKIGEFNTLSTGDGCRTQSAMNFVLNKTKIRRLTPLECERLQGFPDEWTKEGLDKGKIVQISDTQRYKCLGNAVTTNVVYEIAKKLCT